MPQADTKALLARLGALETGQVSDVLDEAGLPNHVLHPSIAGLKPHQPVAGIAACVRGEAALKAAHAAPGLPADTLESVCSSGTVLFIDSGGFTEGAVIGGFVAYSLQREGCAAIVTNGAVRDADEIRGYGIPCYSGRVVPNNGARRWRLVEKDVAVQMPALAGGSLAVRPGDMVLIDADGVVVIPRDVAEQIIGDAEELARIEAKIGSELKAGGVRADVFKKNPRFDHIRPLPPRET
ncbi:RraA family protein [Jiella avicenniae]|uniref:Putative 4-hydroxy-4-methyl-2-oxoglutarate aldolase n=1 Tax=Jiella avicenniae TaxID=2907202 RepID=A0A9X1P494_9HYPH|nr:hypothetical protein [Jiella avicenniae]MCE7029464.1 hypothetical protein [Jiella avicenniae]